MRAIKLRHLLALGIFGLLAIAAGAAPDAWQRPAADLASQVANLLGPGQAQLTVVNLSSIPTGQIPAIRNLLAQELQARGVVPAGPSSASTVRVTLSQSAHERLWVAEIIEGDQTQVAMVDAGPIIEPQTAPAAGIVLHTQPILTASTPILAALETPAGIVALEPEQVVVYGQIPNGWRIDQRVAIGQTRPLPRDPRGILWPSADGEGFEAWLAGAACTGSFANALASGQWTISCRQSDDPWLIAREIPQPQRPPLNQLPALPSPVQVTPAMPSSPQAAPTPAPVPPAQPVATLRAFYNASRDYFTGLVVPSPAVELPPFYSAAFVPRPSGGDALLIGGIDGKVQVLENGALSPVDGARDWGSDFAVFGSGCGPGAQIVASGSGQALSDSLRAYNLPDLEAVPASAPLPVNGTVMALWTASDSKSLIAVVRNAPDQYEVDRVTASCN